MTIEEILAIAIEKPAEAVRQLKGVIDVVPVAEYRDQLDPMKHKIFNKIYRPDKEVENDETKRKVKVPVARIPLALQKLIVERAVSFLFGFDPKIKAEPNGPVEEALLKAVKNVLNISKSNSLNAEVANDLFSCTQVAEMWYATKLKENQNIYGFDSEFKLRNMVFSPLRGDNLYPFYDEENGDLVAFSREYRVTNLDGTFTYFTTYTDERIIHFDITKDAVIIPGKDLKNELKKIPIVFATQPNVEWYVVQSCIERLEDLMSNFADTNDYNGSPILFGKGSIGKAPGKTTAGKFITGTGESADLKYVTWDQAPESMKLEIEKLYDIIFGFTQTPNISFEMVKGIGTTSGIALKLLFMDAHLKVQTKRRIFDTYLIRRINIIKEWLCTVQPEFKSAKYMHIQAEIIPYEIIDYKELYDYLNVANGGQPVMAHDTSVQMTGQIDDVKGEVEKIKKEVKERQLLEAFPENR